ncbi:hypothetical protein ACFX1R_027110 [Malus domestica]
MKVERRYLHSCSRYASWEKLKTSSAACKGPPTAKRPVMDMTSSNGKKNEVARSEHVASAMPRMACMIADRIAQRKGHFMPLVPKHVPRRPLGAKSGSPLEKLAIINSNKVDYVAQVAPRPTSSAIETDSPTGKEEPASMGSCEKSIKPASREADEILCALETRSA